MTTVRAPMNPTLPDDTGESPGGGDTGGGTGGGTGIVPHVDPPPMSPVAGSGGSGGGSVGGSGGTDKPPIGTDKPPGSDGGTSIDSGPHANAPMSLADGGGATPHASAGDLPSGGVGGTSFVPTALPDFVLAPQDPFFTGHGSTDEPWLHDSLSDWLLH